MPRADREDIQELPNLSRQSTAKFRSPHRLEDDDDVLKSQTVQLLFSRRHLSLVGAAAVVDIYHRIYVSHRPFVVYYHP